MHELFRNEVSSQHTPSYFSHRHSISKLKSMHVCTETPSLVTKNSSNLLATQCIAKCIWWNSYMQDIIRRCLVLAEFAKKKFHSIRCMHAWSFQASKEKWSKIYFMAIQTSVWTLKTYVINVFQSWNNQLFGASSSFKDSIRSCIASIMEPDTVFHLYLCF